MNLRQMVGAAAALAALTLTTALAGDLPGMERGFKVVLKEPLITLIAKHEIPEKEAAELVERVKAAFVFVRDTQKWKNPRPINEPFVLKVWPDNEWAEKHKGALAVADDRGFFASCPKNLKTDLSQGTLAHELTHLQDRRASGKQTGLPNYLLEGRALSVGHIYREKVGVKGDDYDRGVAHTVMKVTVEHVREIFKSGGSEDDPQMEPVGVFFVEFLRTRVANRGVADAPWALGRVAEGLGRGEPLGKAFKAEFGVGLEEAHTEFVELLKKTEGKPGARFKGTKYEGLVK